MNTDLTDAKTKESNLQETLQHLSSLVKSYERHQMALEDVDMTQQEGEEKKRVLDRLTKWIPDDRHYDDPGYGLDDSCVLSLLHEWKTDESIRQVALQWMMEYMKKVACEEKN